MSKSFRTVVSIIGLFAGPFMLTAFGNEGSLKLPDRRHANIEFDLQTIPTDIAPSEHLLLFVGKRELCCEDKVPVSGRYLIKGSTISFDPAFDLNESQSYTVLTRGLNTVDNSHPKLTEFNIKPTGTLELPRVVAVYPSADVIPENTLRFYIHFSTPMQPHVSGQFITLVNAFGVPDPEALMTFKQELWSKDRKRLTLLMDPGRIKRGVITNLRLGPALRENKRYSIVVTDGWPSANGSGQTVRYEKKIRVSEALRVLPSTELWSIVPPKIQSLDPLVIEFDRPFDHALLQSAIRVVDDKGQGIPGTVSIENRERTWRFDPHGLWTTGYAQVTVDARLEDVAGNNFRDLLDHSVESKPRRVDKLTIELELKPAEG